MSSIFQLYIYIYIYLFLIIIIYLFCRRETTTTSPQCRPPLWRSLTTTLSYVFREFFYSLIESQNFLVQSKSQKTVNIVKICNDFLYISTLVELYSVVLCPLLWLIQYLIYYREEGVQKFTGKTDPIEVLKVLRKKKDNFKKPKERLPPHAMLALEWGLLRPWHSTTKLIKLIKIYDA